MLEPINYTVSFDKLQEAITQLPEIDFKLAINKPTGNFFYDPWIIKDEFNGSVWDQILGTLPFEKGEARIIELGSGTCYYAHSDIDDRWHLSIQAEHAFLVNVSRQQLYKTEADGKWYLFNTGEIHSAVNFGNKPRIQLVVRKLLNRNVVENPVKISLVLKKYRSDYRYLFDHTISPWLNLANKSGWISDFEQTDKAVNFVISESQIKNLSELLPEEFEIKCL